MQDRDAQADSCPFTRLSTPRFVSYFAVLYFYFYFFYFTACSDREIARQEKEKAEKKSMGFIQDVLLLDPGYSRPIREGNKERKE
jgi:hypothetical protein